MGMFLRGRSCVMISYVSRPCYQPTVLTRPRLGAKFSSVFRHAVDIPETHLLFLLALTLVPRLGLQFAPRIEGFLRTSLLGKNNVASLPETHLRPPPDTRVDADTLRKTNDF